MEPPEALAVLRALAESRNHPESYRALAALDDVVERLRRTERNVIEVWGRCPSQPDNEYTRGWFDAAHFMQYGELPDSRG